MAGLLRPASKINRLLEDGLSGVQQLGRTPVGPAAPGRREAWPLALFCVAGTLAILGWLLKYSRYGVDLTDESFYLVWIANPFLYDWSVYLFGFVYHPLYRLLGGDVAALRQANLLITFALAWALIDVTMRKHARSAVDWRLRSTLSSAFATGALLLVDTWLPTPSYNSLAQQALLVVAMGLVLAEPGASRSSVAGWLLIALGGWLAFMGKPSTAAALAVCAPAYLLLAGKVNLRMLLVTAAIAAGLVLLSAVAIDGSVTKFAQRIRWGVEYLGYLQGGHTVENILRIDRFQINAREKLALVGMALAMCVAALYLSEQHGGRRLGWMICGVLLAGVLLLVAGAPLPDPRFGLYKDMVILAVTLAAAVLAVASAPSRFFATLGRDQWALALLFAVLPHLYAFGTNGNYWQAAGAAGLFWALAGLVLLLPMLAEGRWTTLVPLALGTQLLTALVVYTALLAPYRQPEPLRANSHAVQFGNPGSVLLLSQDNGRYIERVLAAARDAGFTPGTPVIDLGGQSPGILYAMRASSIGQAWTIGGYPGSARLAVAGLQHVPCADIARAWLLVEPKGPRSISGKVLTSFGLDFERDYQTVASWETAKGAGGYAAPRLQLLMKPVRADAEAACRQATSIQPSEAAPSQRP